MDKHTFEWKRKAIGMSHAKPLAAERAEDDIELGGELDGSDANREDAERRTIEIDLLLEAIYRMYGFDYRHYSRPSIQRRILHRVGMDKYATITALTEKVLHDPAVLARLLDDFSIKVTEMFRDPEFFLALRRHVLPELRHLPEIRIWHAGCSTGEEAYSMSILLQEEGLLHKAKLYATDMNERAVAQAREGKLLLKRMQGFTRNYMQAGGRAEFSQYYTADFQYAQLRQQVLEPIVFAQHNLATDRSFNEFHLILCRNVMIYFDPVLQNRVHELFHESLGAQGFLCLGSKESLGNMPVRERYEDIAPAERIYRLRQRA